MSAQSSYSINAGKGYAGQLYGNGPKTVDTGIVETEAGIPAGRVVSKGTNDDQVTLGGDGTGIGIVVRGLDAENNSSDELVYEVERQVAVLIEGDMIVDLANTGNKGDALNYDDSTGIISAGAAATGATALKGVLAETISAIGKARIRLYDQKRS